MIPRKTPRKIPNRPHYMKTADGLDWRIPSIAKCTRVLQMLQKTGIMEAYQESGENGEAFVAALGDRLPVLFACQGALVGMCWANTENDLETKIADYPSLTEYGEEVFEELHEAGWQLEQIQNAWIELVGRLVDSFVSQKEVAEKVDFLSPATGSPI